MGLCPQRDSRQAERPSDGHRYLVDGTPTVAGCLSWEPDLHVEDSVDQRVAGRRTEVFRLDVTNPASPTVLWEKGDAQMGHHGPSAIGRIATSGGKYKWVAFVGGAYDLGRCQIYAINIEGGGIEASATIPNLTGADDTTGTTNGVVGTIRAAGKGYGITDTVFFGDLEGSSGGGTCRPKTRPMGARRPLRSISRLAGRPWNGQSAPHL